LIDSTNLVSECHKNFDLSGEKMEEIMERSGNNQFKATLVGITIGGVVVIIVAYLIRRYFGMSLPALGLIGVIVGNAASALMRRRRARRANSSVSQVLLAASLLACAASSAQAQAFVSAAAGVDAGTCPVTAPCRSVTYSLTQAVEGGTVNVIDSGFYLPFVVNKSVTVQTAPGVVAVITRSSAGAGVIIDTESPEYVTIRGLTLTLPDNLFTPPGESPGFILTGSGTALIDRCVVRGFIIGIDVKMTGRLFVRDTQLSGGTAGIRLNPTASMLSASIERCAVYRATSAGLSVSAGPGAAVRLSVADSQFSVFQYGVRVMPEAGASAVVNLENCRMTGNKVGLSVEGEGATVRVSNSTMTGNEYGLLSGAGGALLSRGNNTVEGNTTDGDFTGVFAAR
jgi:parallel beta helix pectate lyase-like protein